MAPLEEKEAQIEEVTTVRGERELTVFNDDINTFDHVIDTLITICDHSPEQAEQCTWIIHHRGKCAVKMGEAEYLKPMRDAICDRGISAEVI